MPVSAHDTGQTCRLYVQQKRRIAILLLIIIQRYNNVGVRGGILRVTLF